MKKVLMLAGAVFVCVLILLLVLIGVAAMKGRALDRESRQFSDETIRAICSTWDRNQLIARASPELLKSIQSQDGAQQVFTQWRNLGALTSLDSLQGQANTTMLLGKGTRVTAEYVGKAGFKRGAGRIKIALIKRAGKWQVLGFFIDANLTPAAPKSASLLVEPPTALALLQGVRSSAF